MNGIHFRTHQTKPWPLTIVGISVGVFEGIKAAIKQWCGLFLRGGLKEENSIRVKSNKCSQQLAFIY
jgi:hypothetical protein